MPTKERFPGSFAFLMIKEKGAKRCCEKKKKIV